jgi:hypothetical protein
MDDHIEKDPLVRRFTKGDKVLAPWIAHSMPLAEVLEVYEATDGGQVLLVSYVINSGHRSLCHAEAIAYVGDRKFVVVDEGIYRVSNGEVVAQSRNWANIIADFLETFTPPVDTDAETDSQAHEQWIELNE